MESCLSPVTSRASSSWGAAWSCGDRRGMAGDDPSLPHEEVDIGGISSLLSSHHQRAHGVEGSAERVEHEAKDLERDDADQRFSVTRLAEDDRRVALAVRENEEALRNGPADGRAVGEHEVHLALWRESDGPPHRFGKERVGGPAVDQEADGGFRARRPADGSLNVADTHAPEDGVPGASAVIGSLPGGANPRQGARPVISILIVTFN